MRRTRRVPEGVGGADHTVRTRRVPAVPWPLGDMASGTCQRSRHAAGPQVGARLASSRDRPAPVLDEENIHVRTRAVRDALRPRRRREPHRHHRRVVRLLPLRLGRRAGLQQAVLPRASTRSSARCCPSLTYAVGFAARPIGALVFGHFGDRIGRKKLLVISLLMMGGATFAIGLLPTYATVGVLAPILLVTLRLIQGFALGGEWGGAVLIVSEHGKPENRGFWASWPQAGAPGGQPAGHRRPGAAGRLPVRRGVRGLGLAHPVPALGGADHRRPVGPARRSTESPVFLEAQRVAAEKAAETGVAEKAPIVTVLGHYKREVLVAMGARIAENISFYLLTAFILAYLTNGPGADSSFALNAVLIASAVHLVTIPLWGALSDRIGRRPVYLFGAVGIGVWVFAFFGLLDSRATSGSASSPSPSACCSTARCTARRRRSSPSCSAPSRATPVRRIGAQLASLVAGAPAPLIALALLGSFEDPNPTRVVAVPARLRRHHGRRGLSYGETRTRDLGRGQGRRRPEGRRDRRESGRGQPLVVVERGWPRTGPQSRTLDGSTTSRRPARCACPTPTGGTCWRARSASITGGGGSLGLATARLFLKEGARVVLADRDAAALTAAPRRAGRRQRVRRQSATPRSRPTSPGDGHRHRPARPARRAGGQRRHPGRGGAGHRARRRRVRPHPRGATCAACSSPASTGCASSATAAAWSIVSSVAGLRADAGVERLRRRQARPGRADAVGGQGGSRAAASG